MALLGILGKQKQHPNVTAETRPGCVEDQLRDVDRVHQEESPSTRPWSNLGIKRVPFLVVRGL